MKVTYLVPGSGDSFYCGNCHRDRLYVSSIRGIKGVQISAIPLYLPPIGEDFGDEFEKPVFFGAVSMYLRERVKMFEYLPSFMDKVLDAPPLLRYAAKKAGTTRPEGFEETTLNMIRGNVPSRQKEVLRLSNHISKNGKPDIIHLSNALIMGLASQLRNAVGSKIICSLQNEDEWIEEMIEPFRSKAWTLIGKESKNVDMFICPSNYYKDFIIKKLGRGTDELVDYVQPYIIVNKLGLKIGIIGVSTTDTEKMSYPENIPVRTPEIQEIIRNSIIKALRIEAKEYLPDRTYELAKKLGFKLNRVFIKNNKTLWGSCSGKNNINLNLHLLRLPSHLIDYVIIHELCHTVEKNHGKNFWALLDKVSGNAKGLDKQLKKYNTSIY